MAINKSIIHCPTRELFDKTLVALSDIGTLSDYVDVWETYGDETCICVNDSSLSYASKEWYANRGYGESIEAKDFLNLEGDKIMARRTFKLLVETPTLRKGAVYQEACDDGTQQYELLDKSFNKEYDVENLDSRNSGSIHNRDLVENNPKHFVEVFKVEPEYMTAHDLVLYKEFLSSKKTTKKANKRKK